MPALIRIALLFFVFSSCTNKNSSQVPYAFKQSHFSYMGFSKRNITLEFGLSGNLEKVIVAKMTLPKNQNVDTLNFTWTFDGSVVLVSGPAQGTINLDKDSKVVETRIRVKNFNPENKSFIRFSVKSAGKNSDLFTDGIISSQFKNSFEDAVQNVELYKAKNQND